MSTEISGPAKNNKPSDAGTSTTVVPSDERSGGPQPKKPLVIPGRWLDWRLALVLILAALSIPLWRLLTSHPRVDTQVLLPTAQPVAVARVTREDVYNEVTIPAEFRAYLQVELHAK